MSIAIFSGNNASLTAGGGNRDTLVVRLLQRDGGFAVDGLVTWHIDAGPGTLSDTVSHSDDKGLARIIYAPSTTTGAVTVRASTKLIMPILFTIDVK